MICKRILTGSKEFFDTDNHDTDYIIIMNQAEDFIYENENNICYFKYKLMTKEEFFIWQEEKNQWYLNFSPLVSKEFLDFMQIDILNTDYQRVYNIIKKAFRFICNTAFGTLNKYIYKMWIYYCYIKKKELSLTEDELETAKNIKDQIYDNPNIIKDLYSFFDCLSIYNRIKVIIKWEFKIEKFQKWFSDYFDKQLIQAIWQKDYIPSNDVILNKTYKDFEELKQQAQIIRNKLIEHYKKTGD